MSFKIFEWKYKKSPEFHFRKSRKASYCREITWAATSALISRRVPTIPVSSARLITHVAFTQSLSHSVTRGCDLHSTCIASVNIMQRSPTNGFLELPTGIYHYTRGKRSRLPPTGELFQLHPSSDQRTRPVQWTAVIREGEKVQTTVSHWSTSHGPNVLEMKILAGRYAS